MRSFLAAVGFLVAGWAVSAAEPAYPHIWSPRQVIELAGVRPNGTVPVEFILQNLGDATLHLGKITANCGCTVVELAEREIPPRGEVKLKVIYTAGPYQERGSKRIKVESDDPRRPVLHLTLKVRVQADLDWQPRQVYLEWPVPENTTGRITLTGLGTEPIHLGRVSAEGGFLQARIEANDARETVVLFNLPPEAAYRPQDVIRIETSSSDYPVVQVPVYFQKPSLLTLTPARVSLWMHAGDAPPVRRLVISRKDGQPIAIQSVTPSHPRLRATVVQQSGSSVIVEVTLAPAVPAGPCDGSLRIVTDAETVNVNIPCQVVARGQTPSAP